MECKDVIIYTLIIIIFLYFFKTYKKIIKPPSSHMVPNEHYVLVDNKFPIYTSKPNYFTNIHLEDNYNKSNNNLENLIHINEPNNYLENLIHINEPNNYLENSTDLNKKNNCLNFYYNKNYNNLEDTSYLPIDTNTQLQHIENKHIDYIFNYDKSYNIQEQFENEKLYKLF